MVSIHNGIPIIEKKIVNNIDASFFGVIFPYPKFLLNQLFFLFFFNSKKNILKLNVFKRFTLIKF